MNPDLDTLATRLYVTIDDALVDHPEWAPERPTVGIAPKLSDAELVTLAVLQALLGFTSEARFIRHARTHLRPWFRYLPDRPGYNKRLRRSGQLMVHAIGFLARQCPSFTDDLWLVDSTPVECGRSRETAKRSDLAGWATYGYCASHSRFFWGLRLHLVTTPSGLPIAFALAGAKTDERDTCLDMIAFGDLDRAGQTLIADKGYRRASFETELTNAGITLIRPALKSEPDRPGRRYLKAFRQTIESVNQTLKAQLDLERHGGRTRPGVAARILQRLLALTTAIWNNETTNRASPPRSLTPYDH
jgi:hypothetical protein